MQREKVQASHQADQASLQAAMDSLQVQSRQLHRRHQHWAWQLAALLHWKRQGALQLRKLLHSWATLTAASRPDRPTTLHKESIRSKSEASHTGRIVSVSEAPGYLGAQSATEEACYTAGAEDGLPGLRPVPDGWAHHDRRVLGACFTGNTHACRVMLCSWSVAGAASSCRILKRQYLASMLAIAAAHSAVRGDWYWAWCHGYCVACILVSEVRLPLSLVLTQYVAVQAGCLRCRM